MTVIDLDLSKYDRLASRFATEARQSTSLLKSGIDMVGLGLLIVWVGSLQLMVDEGKDLDWFNSPVIVALGLTSLVGFVAFSGSAPLIAASTSERSQRCGEYQTTTDPVRG